MSKFIDLSGQRFGRLVALARDTNDSTGKAMWRCLCDCGNYATVRRLVLRNGNTSSCGCLRRGASIERNRKRRKHELSGTPAYRSWTCMMRRCFKENHSDYPDYGARGITVCERWRTFDNFLADMGERPPGMSLERTDNCRGYETGNCVWASAKTQARNRRNSKLGEVDVIQIRWLYLDGGVNQTEIARAYGIARNYVSQLVHRVTWKA